MTDSDGFEAEVVSAAPSRRAFLLGAAGITGVAVAAGTSAWNSGAAQAASDGRSYVSGYFALKLDDINCGLIQKFEGGDIEAEVVTLPVAHDYYTKKHIGNVKYNDFSVEMGGVISEKIQKWIQGGLNGKFSRQSGEIQASDFQQKIQRVHEFTNALLTEISFPGVDASSKDAQKLTLKFAPEFTRVKKGSGKLDAHGKAPGDSSGSFDPSNFKLTIAGLEATTAKVSKVEAISIKQTTARDDIGQERDYQREPGKIDFPNLKITIDDKYADDFWKWHDDAVVVRGEGADNSKLGTLVYLDPATQKPLLELTFSGLGIFKGSVADVNDHSDPPEPQSTFELFVETIGAKFAPGTAGPAETTTTTTGGEVIIYKPGPGKPPGK